MSAFLEELERVAGDLDRLQAEWALVGALAYSVHAEPRTTRDIDAAVAVAHQDDLDRLVDGLALCGYGPKQLLLQSGPVRRLGVRLRVPSRKAYAIPLDLLSASCGIECEIVAAALRVEVLPSVSVPVASLGHVLAMKLLSQDDFDRIRDRADVSALISLATSEDLAQT